MQTVARLFLVAGGPGAALLSEELWLPTGRLVTCNPAAHAQMRPFAPAVPPGAYPVVVHRSPDYAGALDNAELRVRPVPVGRWALALTAGQDAAALGLGEGGGCSVDAGLSCWLGALLLAGGLLGWFANSCLPEPPAWGGSIAPLPGVLAACSLACSARG
jgi:hypothetical protein